MKKYKWTEDELFILGLMIGDYPIDILCKLYNKKIKIFNRNNKTNYPFRSKKSITYKILELEGSISASSDYFSIAEICRILKCSYWSIYYYIRKGCLKIEKKEQKKPKRKKKNNCGVYITRKAFTDFCMEYPYVAKRMDEQSLSFILEDNFYLLKERWKDPVISRYISNRRIKIRNNITGKYESAINTTENINYSVTYV